MGPGLVYAEPSRAQYDFRAELEAPDKKGVQPQFLLRLVDDAASLQNRGITRLSLRRDAARPDLWHILTQVKNYGHERSEATLAFSVNGQTIGQRPIALAPDGLVNVDDQILWNQGGILQAAISPGDALQADDRAIVNLPAFRAVRIAIVAGSASPFASELRSVLSSDPYAQADVVTPEAAANASPDIAIYQGTNLPAQADFDSIFFLSGPSTAEARPVRVIGWNSLHPVSRWVRTRDISVRNPATLQVQRGDTVLAYSEGDPPAPLILAREQGGHRILVVGFNPHDSNIPLESAFPLLMAGSIEWMTRSVDEVAGSRSTGELDWPGPVVKITGPSGKEVPFAREDSGVHFLALETGIYRVTAPGSETSVAVNPPALPSERVQPLAEETADPAPEQLPPGAWSMWRWLVVMAIAALWLEWWLYHSARERQRAAEIQELPGDLPREDLDVELEEPGEPRFRSSNLVGR